MNKILIADRPRSFRFPCALARRPASRVTPSEPAAKFPVAARGEDRVRQRLVS